MAWTEKQQQAIDAISGNVLVSASAGSGKTAVMIERVISLVQKHRVEVLQLLVVTFASDAAYEMRERLLAALKKVQSNNSDETSFISRQIANVEISSICTLHSFCLDLLRTYFYKINLDPQFNVISESDLDSLKNRALLDVISAGIDSDDVEFISLLDIFSQKRHDRAFKELILKLYDYANAKEDFEGYFSGEFLSTYENPKKIEDYIYSQMFSSIDFLIKILSPVAKKCHAFSLVADGKVLDEIMSYLESLSSKNICESLLNLPRFPNGNRKSGISTEQALVHAEYEEKRKIFKNMIKPLVDNFCKTLPRLYSDATTMKGHIQKLGQTTLAFRSRLQELKSKKCVVDFSDFEHFAVQLLAYPEVVDSLRARYKYVFVDEYQDINGVQESILRSVSRGDNLFMVGDLKQSIYAFRQCDPQIFADKYSDYKSGQGGLPIELNANFRSKEGVLEFCNGVFSAVMTKNFGGTNYLADSQFVGKSVYLTDDFKACVGVHMIDILNEERELPAHVYDIDGDEFHEESESGAKYEANLIASLIDEYLGKSIYNSKTEKLEKVRYQDIVILVRGFGNYEKQILSYLRNVAALPVLTSGEDTGDFAVGQIMDLLKVLSSTKQDIPLASVMLSPFGGFSENELAMIKLQDGESKFFFERVIYASENADFPLQNKVKGFLLLIEKYRNVLTFESLSGTVTLAIRESGFDRYIMSRKHGSQKMLRVQSFLCGLEGSFYNHDLAGYLYDIELKNSLHLGDITKSIDGAIRMMTIHRSKGLEFPIVILAGGYKRFNVEDVRGKILLCDGFGCGLDSYDTVGRVKLPSAIKEATKAKLRLKMKEEELRLLYVALTRAKNRLDITLFSSVDELVSSREIFHESMVNSYADFMSYFIKDAKDTPYQFLELLTYFEKDFDLETPKISNQALEFLPPNRELYSVLEKEMQFKYKGSIDTLAEQKYTVTGLIEKPILFDERKIEKGNFYHAMIEAAEICSDMKTLEKIACELPFDFVPSSAEILCVHKVLNSELLKSFAGMEIFKEQEFILNALPLDIGGSGSERVLVQGKIDMLIINGEKAVIIDFKSHVKNQKSAVRFYKKQLELYVLAVEKSLSKKVEKSIIYSIEGNNYFII